MRARRGVLLGRAAVVLWAALLAALGVDAALEDDHRRVEPAAAFVEAWARSRRATFVTTGTFERRSAVTGAVISSADVVAQRPPRRLHRQLGGVEGRVDDRLLVCPAGPEGAEAAPCHLGEPGGPTYDESVAREVDGLRSILLGPAPLYEVRRRPGGCFDLEQARLDPRAPFGVSASFCFDDATGAPAGSRVRYEGGVEERRVVTAVRAEVTDADLEP